MYQIWIYTRACIVELACKTDNDRHLIPLYEAVQTTANQLLNFQFCMSHFWCFHHYFRHKFSDIFSGQFRIFLTCVRRLTHVIAIGWTSVCLSVCMSVCLSVRLSVCPSVTRWYCVETAQPIVIMSSLPGSPMFLVLWGPNFSRISNGNTRN